VSSSEMARFKRYTEQRMAQFDGFRDNFQQLALASDE